MNAFIRIGLLLAMLTFCVCSQEKNYYFSGTVSGEGGEALSFATIRIAGTASGTVCNGDGRYAVSLPAGEYRFIISYVGYESCSLHVYLISDTSIAITLGQSEILLAELVINGEDPSYPVIREAIRRKQLARRLLRSYTSRVYTKDTFGTDTALALFSEAYSDIRWSAGDSLRESIVYRRQSTNVLKEIQIAKVNDFINFTNETVRVWGYTFITPLADSAFHVYDYRLINTYVHNNQKYYDIEIIVRSEMVPLFAGTITILDSCFALQRVKLRPNTVFTIPFFGIDRFEIIQQFALYENTFWMPLDYHFVSNMKFRFMQISFPQTLYYNKSVVCFEYRFNEGESVKNTPVFSLLPSAATYDTSLWRDVKLFPLTDIEKRSFARIEGAMKTQTWTARSIFLYNNYQRELELIDVRYNRAEGLFLGARGSHNLLQNIRFHGKLGTGLSDQRWKYSVGAEYLLSTSLSLSIGVEKYVTIHTFPLKNGGGKVITMLSSLLSGTDYHDYYLGRGDRLSVSLITEPLFTVTADLGQEQQTSLLKKTDFSFGFIGTNKKYRSNPVVDDGLLRYIALELSNQHESPSAKDLESQDRWRCRIVHSLNTLGSSFRFTSVHAQMIRRIPTMGVTRIFNPYLELSASAGVVTDTPPVQQTFAFDTPVSGIVYPQAFRTASLNEFTGQYYYSFSMEHNFRNIPFIMIGLPSISFDLIARVAAGAAFTASEHLKLRTYSTNGIYPEFSFGIGRIGDIFRVDVSHSPYQRSRFSITLTGGV